MSKKWWLIYNDYSKSIEYFKIIDFIFLTFKTMNLQCIKIPSSDLTTNFDKTISKISFMADSILFWDKNWEIAIKLQTLGMHIYNNPNNAIICENKIKTYQKLINSGIIPKTVIYSIEQAKENLESLKNFIGLPLFAKFQESCLGSNVFYLKDINTLINFINNHADCDMVAFQEALTFSSSTVVKVFSTSNHVMSSYKCISLSNGQFKYENYYLSNKECEISCQACRTLGLDFAGIDIMYRKDDVPLICDINTQPNVLNIFNILGINVIKAFIDTL